MPILFVPPSDLFESLPFQPFGPSSTRQSQLDFADEYAHHLGRAHLARLAERSRNEQRRRLAEQEYVDALRAEIESQQRLRARQQALRELERRERRHEEAIRRHRAQVEAKRRVAAQRNVPQYKEAADDILDIVGLSAESRLPCAQAYARQAGPSTHSPSLAPVITTTTDARPIDSPGGDLAPVQVEAITLAHARIATLRKEFSDMTNNFALPESLSFAKLPTSPDSAPSPLAFSATNKPLLAHEESLLRLLTKLDEIDSGGDQQVKESRKALVRDVEAELTNLDTFKVQEWEKQVKIAFGAHDAAEKIADGEHVDLPSYDAASSTSVVHHPLDAVADDSSAGAIRQPLDNTTPAAIDVEIETRTDESDATPSDVSDTMAPTLQSAAPTILELAAGTADADSQRSVALPETAPLLHVRAHSSDVIEHPQAVGAANDAVDAVVQEEESMGSDSEEEFEMPALCIVGKSTARRRRTSSSHLGSE